MTVRSRPASLCAASAFSGVIGHLPFQYGFTWSLMSWMCTCQSMSKVGLRGLTSICGKSLLNTEDRLQRHQGLGWRGDGTVDDRFELLASRRRDVEAALLSVRAELGIRHHGVEGTAQERNTLG